MVNDEIQVLLAAYQGEKWLPSQLASLREQEDPHFTVLMQDDGSDDGTAGLLLNAMETDTRFRLAAHPGMHLGAIGNFWDLLRQSPAPYIAFCDQDDSWHPDRLSRCRSAMLQAEAQWGAETPLLIHSDCCVVDENDQLLQGSLFLHQGWDPKAVTLAPLLVQNNVTGCTVLINRPLADLALRTGHPDQMLMHDWYLALAAAAFGHIIFLDEPLLDYRQHASNVKGASRLSLAQRAVRALGGYQRGKSRIALTYTHTQMFLNSCGSILPSESKSLLLDYLATERMSKPQRILTARKLGCIMQSPITRMGQIFFG